LASYTVIAFAYGLGWQKQPTILVAGFVAALGAIHEYSEIFTHDHTLEIADILVNSMGAWIGLAFERDLVRATARAYRARPALGRATAPALLLGIILQQVAGKGVGAIVESCVSPVSQPATS
jgi:hypothetical protein